MGLAHFIMQTTSTARSTVYAGCDCLVARLSGELYFIQYIEQEDAYYRCISMSMCGMCVQQIHFV